jgi:MFS transporter, FSR family, fosmidomycin resistance protein
LRYKPYILLGIGHLLNDCVAGFLLGGLMSRGIPLAQIGIMVLVYNLLAFGGQLPFAWVFDRFPRPKETLQMSLFFSAIAILIAADQPFMAIILSGIASALYHVAGGVCCLQENGRSFTNGIFAAPGVLGLVAGGFAAYTGTSIGWALLLATIAGIAVLHQHEFPAIKKLYARTGPKLDVDAHDIIMIILLTGISLRSVVWNLFQLMYEHNYTWLFAIAITAMLGKIIGGAMADRIGWRLYLFCSLSLSIPLLSFFKHNIVALCAGIALLQSSIPVSMTLMYRIMPARPAMAVSYNLGLSIILGALIFFTPLQAKIDSPYFIGLVLLLSLLLFSLASRRMKKLVW